MNTAEATPEMLDLVLKDWNGGNRAHLDSIPRDTTVGQLVGEATRAMQLPLRSFFKAVFRGRELSHADTLEEIGIASGDELEIMPHVSAGKR